MISALNLTAILGITWWIWRVQPAPLRNYFLAGLSAKLLAGIALGLLYKYYYSISDTFTLFNLAEIQTEEFYHNPSAFFDFLTTSTAEQWKGQLRSSFFVKILSVANIITYNNYWVTGFWFSLLAFFSAWYLLRVIMNLFPDAKLAAASAFLFFPSVVFWSSGIIKECLAMAGLYLLAAVWLKCMMKSRVRFWEWLVVILSIWICWNLKYYWVAVFVPIAVVSVFIRLIDDKVSWIIKYAIAAVLVLLAVVGIRFVHPNFYPGHFLTVLVANHDAFLPISRSDQLVHFYHLNAAWSSILLNAPWALFSGFFRPLPGEGHGFMAAIASIENLLFFTVFIASVTLKRLPGSSHRLILSSIIVYCVVLCIFLSLSTPNFGSLARYKIGFVPFLAFIVLYQNPMILWIQRKIEK